MVPAQGRHPVLLQGAHCGAYHDRGPSARGSRPSSRRGTFFVVRLPARGDAQETRPTNFFVLSGATVQPTKLGFDLIFSNGERRSMMAASEEDRDAWVAALRETIQRQAQKKLEALQVRRLWPRTGRRTMADRRLSQCRGFRSRLRGRGGATEPSGTGGRGRHEREQRLAGAGQHADARPQGAADLARRLQLHQGARQGQLRQGHAGHAQGRREQPVLRDQGDQEVGPHRRGGPRARARREPRAAADRPPVPGEALLLVPDRGACQPAGAWRVAGAAVRLIGAAALRRRVGDGVTRSACTL